MLSVFETKILPEHAKVKIMIDYVDQWDNDWPHTETIIDYYGKEKVVPKEFRFLGTGHTDFDTYSFLDQILFVESISEDDLDWGEKGLAKVKIILTDEIPLFDQEKVSLTSEYDFVGAVTSRTEYPVVLGVSEAIEYGFDEDDSLRLSGKDYIDIEIFRNSARDEVIFLVLER